MRCATWGARRQSSRCASASSGEEWLDETLLLLCELNDVQIPELPELCRVGNKQQQARIAERMQLMEDVRGWDEILQREAESSEGMLLELRCTRCQREYTYDVGTVYYDLNAMDQPKDKPRGDEFWFQKRVVCKKCGAIDAGTNSRAKRTSPYLPSR